MLNRGEVASAIALEQKQSVLDFIDGVNTGVRGKVQICSIIDWYVFTEAAQEVSGRLCALVNASRGESYLTYRFDYVTEEEKARLCPLRLTRFSRSGDDRPSSLTVLRKCSYGKDRSLLSAVPARSSAHR